MGSSGTRDKFRDDPEFCEVSRTFGEIENSWTPCWFVGSVIFELFDCCVADKCARKIPRPLE